MIDSAEEFIRLRQSGDLNEQSRAAHEPADIKIWLDVVEKFPGFKIWVVQNKTLPIEILELLATDKDANVRIQVAGKRKITDSIFSALAKDKDENVRYALMRNTKLSADKKRTIKTEDSPWLASQIAEILGKDI